MWLKERLGLEISPEKSKIVNLKRQYSEFLGFKLKAKIKGKKSNGEPKYVVTSHISNKASKKIQIRAKETICNMRHQSEKEKMYKYIGLYNSFVMGVHQYYAIATEVNEDFHKISFHVNRTLKRKLGNKLKRPNVSSLKCKAIVEKYGKSKELRSIYDLPVVPIGYVQHRNPMWKRAAINKYTEKGRAEIHKSLKGIDMDILLYLMRNPIPNRSIEYNDNRISLYSGQMGKCAVTGKRLCINEIHCHHKVPVKHGGNDDYSNLKIVHADVHRLIHAVKNETIQQLLVKIKLTDYQLERVNALRKLCKLSEIMGL